MRSQTFNLIILSPNRYFVHQPCGFRLESSCVQLDRREGSPVGESQSDHSVWQVPPIMPRHAQVKVESWMILVVTISVQLKITCLFWILIVNTWLVNINYSIGPITESSMIKQCQHELINIHELSTCFMQPLHRDAVTVFIHFYSFFQLSFISASGNAARAKCVFWNVNQVCVCLCCFLSCSRFKKIIPIPEQSMVQMLCFLLECLLIPEHTPPDSHKDLYELYFVFAAIWAFGGTMFQDQVDLMWLNYRLSLKVAHTNCCVFSFPHDFIMNNGCFVMCVCVCMFAAAGGLQGGVQ